MSTMVWIIGLYVAVVLQLPYSSCLECYSCTDVTMMSDCKSVTQCPAGYVCHAYLRSNKFSLGCIDSTLCPVTNTSTNTSTNTTTNTSTSTLVGRSLSASTNDECSACCTTSNCNRQLCQPDNPTCSNSGAIECDDVGSYVNFCSLTDHAKKVCRKFCGLCDMVDGGWSAWISWSPCSVSCDNGTQTRTRSCSDPYPASGGSNCTGVSHETRTCSKGSCPVNGNWSHWSSWGSCSVSCGIGLQHRDRACNNPYPSNSGIHCFGDARDDRICTTVACQDGGWTEWSDWNTCSSTCGAGVQTSSRSCTNPTPSALGKSCTGDNVKVRTCSGVGCVDGGWTEWSGWNTCSSTCGIGVQSSSRSCTNSTPSVLGNSCTGDNVKVRTCSGVGCVDGGWTEWSGWNTCSSTCGTGVQTSSRSCTNPTPSALGKACTGDNVKVRTCSGARCVDTRIGFTVGGISKFGTNDSNAIFSNVYTNQGGGYNTSSGLFTCSVPGMYAFSLDIMKASSAVEALCWIYRNDKYLVAAWVKGTSNGDYLPASTAVYVHLVAGDRVYVGHCSALSAFHDDTHVSLFTGYLVDADYH